MSSTPETGSPEALPVSEKASAPLEEVNLAAAPLEDLPKGRWERSWPVIACGAGLFSDGYLNGVCLYRSINAHVS
jgi:hypothetical protein